MDVVDTATIFFIKLTDKNKVSDCNLLEAIRYSNNSLNF